MLLMHKLAKHRRLFFNLFSRNYTASSDFQIRISSESLSSTLDPVPERVPLKPRLSLRPSSDSDEVSTLNTNCSKRLQFWQHEYQSSVSNIRSMGLQQLKVQHEGPPENLTLLMNRYLSTPYDCARRVFNFFLIAYSYFDS